MVTAGIVALVVIAWFAYRTYAQQVQARLEENRDRQFRLCHWTKDDEGDGAAMERVLSFSDMRLVVRVHVDDGGYLADMDRQQRESWEAKAVELEVDGWTKKEWMDHDAQVFEVRRTPEGGWQTRLAYKHWKAQVAESLERSASFDDEFKGLTGLTKADWRQRGTFYGDACRPWTNVSDEFAPSIEASYQRYVHVRD